MEKNMNNNTKETTAKTIMKDLLTERDSQKLKLDLEYALCEEVDDVAHLSPEQLSELVNHVAEYAHVRPLAETVARETANKLLFDPTNPKWLLSIAVKAAVTVAGVVGGVWVADKLGILANGHSVQDPFANQQNQFTDTTEASPASTEGKNRGSISMFDRQAS
jgi:hypothetical protein